jgi:hypothetical protein
MSYNCFSKSVSTCDDFLHLPSEKEVENYLKDITTAQKEFSIEDLILNYQDSYFWKNIIAQHKLQTKPLQSQSKVYVIGPDCHLISKWRQVMILALIDAIHDSNFMSSIQKTDKIIKRLLVQQKNLFLKKTNTKRKQKNFAKFFHLQCAFSIFDVIAQLSKHKNRTTSPAKYLIFWVGNFESTDKKSPKVKEDKSKYYYHLQYSRGTRLTEFQSNATCENCYHIYPRRPNFSWSENTLLRTMIETLSDVIQLSHDQISYQQNSNLFTATIETMTSNTEIKLFNIERMIQTNELCDNFSKNPAILILNLIQQINNKQKSGNLLQNFKQKLWPLFSVHVFHDQSEVDNFSETRKEIIQKTYRYAKREAVEKKADSCFTLVNLEETFTFAHEFSAVYQEASLCIQTYETIPHYEEFVPYIDANNQGIKHKFSLRIFDLLVISEDCKVTRERSGVRYEEILRAGTTMIFIGSFRENDTGPSNRTMILQKCSKYLNLASSDFNDTKFILQRILEDSQPLSQGGRYLLKQKEVCFEESKTKYTIKKWPLFHLSRAALSWQSYIANSHFFPDQITISFQHTSKDHTQEETASFLKELFSKTVDFSGIRFLNSPRINFWNSQVLSPHLEEKDLDKINMSTFFSRLIGEVDDDSEFWFFSSCLDFFID